MRFYIKEKDFTSEFKSFLEQIKYEIIKQDDFLDILLISIPGTLDASDAVQLKAYLKKLGKVYMKETAQVTDALFFNSTNSSSRESFIDRVLDVGYFQNWLLEGFIEQRTLIEYFRGFKNILDNLDKMSPKQSEYTFARILGKYPLEADVPVILTVDTTISCVAFFEPIYYPLSAKVKAGYTLSTFKQIFKDMCQTIVDALRSGMAFYCSGRSFSLDYASYEKINLDLLLENTDLKEEELQYVTLPPTDKEKYITLKLLTIANVKSIKLISPPHAGVYIGKGGENIREIAKRNNKYIKFINNDKLE